MSFYTPLRYPGGKAKFTSFFDDIIQSNNLSQINYVEPYAGGAGVALGLLFSGTAKAIYLNDLDYSVYCFWYAVLNETDALCKKIIDTSVTPDEWIKQKSIRNQNTEYSTLDVGFSTFFLNRTNRSGILEAGMIGGKAQAGDWKMDVRYNKIDLIKRIEKIASRASNIHLSNLDAAYFLQQEVTKLPTNETLVYLDPPYFVKGKQLYKNHYVFSDHYKIAYIVKNDLKCHWVVSYDDELEIRDLYSKTQLMEMTLSYTAGTKRKGSEVFFFSDNLNIKDTKELVS
ncbi:MAG: DNA adenine methylase [Campylobacterota bacterium]